MKFYVKGGGPNSILPKNKALLPGYIYSMMPPTLHVKFKRQSQGSSTLLLKISILLLIKKKQGRARTLWKHNNFRSRAEKKRSEISSNSPGVLLFKEIQLWMYLIAEIHRSILASLHIRFGQMSFLKLFFQLLVELHEVIFEVQGFNRPHEGTNTPISQRGT